MRWTDGSTYMGTWKRGIQEGVGIMIFPDGARRAGIFEMNVFKATLKTPEQLEPFKEDLEEECIRELEKFLNVQISRNGIGAAAASQ